MKQISAILLFISALFICLLFANALLIDYEFDIGEFDWKIIYFNIVSCIAILFVGLFLAGRNGITVSTIDLWLVAFTVFIAINYWGKVGLYNNFLAAISLITIIFVLVKQLVLVSEKKELLIVFFSTAILLTALYENLFGIAQLFRFVASPGNRIPGTFHNPGIYAIYIAALCSFSVGYYLFSNTNERHSSILKNLSVLNILLAIIVLPATHSRAAWLGAMASIGLLVIIRYRATVMQLKKYRLLLIPLFLVCAIFLSLYLYTFKKDSADGRTVIWKTALIALKENKMTGIGFDQIQNKFPDYQAAYFEEHPGDAIKFTDNVVYSFNDLLHMSVENGIIGLLLFVLFLTSVLLSIIKNRNPGAINLAAIGGLLCILISSMFSYPFEVISIRFLFFFLITLAMFNLKEEIVVRLKKLPSLIILLLVIFSTIYFLYQQYNIIQSKSLITRAQMSVDRELFKEAANHYKNALEYTPYQKRILLGYGLTFLKTKEYDQSIRVFSEAQKYISDPYLDANLGIAYEGTGNYAETERCFKKAIKMMPNRMYFKYLLAKMYITSKNEEAARKAAQEILTMPVKIESIATREMKGEMQSFLENNYKQQ